MAIQYHLLIPLACAFLYVLGAMAVKRAAAFGVGVWRSSFVANWMMLVVFAPFWLSRPAGGPPLADYWQPAVVGLCFLAGQVLVFLALAKGDVSVTTPVMGSKVLLVAAFSSLLRVGEVPLKWWIGAGLSALAIVLLHAGERRGEGRRVGLTVLLAGGSAACFGLGDVLMTKWVPAWGVTRFFPAMFFFVALYSTAFVPFFHAPLRTLPAPAWRWVLLGSALLAVNNSGVVLTLGLWGGATAVNIVYSFRGLVSVFLVWAIGHWFASEEQALSPAARRGRLGGAALMIAAIVLVLV